MSDETSQPIESDPVEPVSTSIEPVIESPTAQFVSVPEEPKAQMGRNEPFTEPEPVLPEVKPTETQTPPPQQTEAMTPSVSAPVVIQTSHNPVRDILSKARAFIQI